MRRPRHDSVTRFALAAILWVSACWGCAHRIPMAWRPDTRHIGLITMDSAAIEGTLSVFQAALPHEGAVCYRGELHDTTILALDDEPVEVSVLHLTGVTEARHDSLTEHVYHDSISVMRVWFKDHRAGCADDIIAVAHSHPNAWGPCTHSHDDAGMLFGNPRAFASMIWCGDGRSEVLFQDGRRQSGRWR